MSGPSKINEGDKIPRALPTLLRLLFHADPATGIAKACTLQELLQLFTGQTPIKTYADQTALLANTNLGIGYLALVSSTGLLYVYNGPSPGNIANYTLLFNPYTSPFPQVTASGTNTYTATPSPEISAYSTGQKFQIKFTNASTGAATLNLNSVGAKKIYTNPTTQAATDDITAGQIYLLIYDAALDSAAGGFLMVGGGGGSGSGKGVAKTYADIAAMLADQAAQHTDFFYLVTDASADATVDAGWAVYQKLAATTAAITDYRKLAEAESLDVIIAGTPDWDDTTKGKVERAIQAEAETAADVTPANRENERGITARSFRWAFDAVWTWIKTQAQTFAAQVTFTSAPKFSSTTASQFLKVDNNKDLTSTAPATAADIHTGTDNGKPATPQSIKGHRNISRQTISPSAGILTIPLGTDLEEARFEVTTAITAATEIQFSGGTSMEQFVVHIPITGGVAFQMPTAVVVQESDTRYVNGTKILTLTAGVGTSHFQLSYTKRGSAYELVISSRFPAS